MTKTSSLPWSQRRYAWFLLVATFILGVLVGLLLSAHWEVDRIVRESERRTSDAMADIRSRPTLHQRFDVIEHRLQAIEQRLTP